MKYTHMIKQKKKHKIPREVGVLLCEEHYFTPSKLVIVYSDGRREYVKK